MFPKKAIGSIIGIGGMAGGIGGVIVSKLGGYLFDYYEALGHIQTGYTIMVPFRIYNILTRLFVVVL